MARELIKDKKKFGQNLLSTGLFIAAFVVVGCGTGSKSPSKGAPKNSPSGDNSAATSPTTSTSAKTVSLTWDPNKEADVNSTGGGYRVYYSTTNPVPSNASFVAVSYSSGSYAPANADITGLTSGTWFFKVVAFSARNTAGSTSTQVSVAVP